MNTILIIILLISIIYLLLISAYSIGWFSLKTFYSSGKLLSTKVSIIIAARNEEANIENCLNDIIKQKYNKDLFEIIVIDDESTDKTVETVENIIKTNYNINIKLLQNNQSTGNKKAALTKGINSATGELIITTDADCRMGEKWLSSIVDYFESSNAKMIIGPVCYHNENTLFKKIQSFEFLSLIGTTAGAACIRIPIMCNGANLAFEKKCFEETGGYNKNEQYASGDDVFLMMNIHNKYPSGIKFLKNKEAIVYTEAKETLKDFTEQRKRWVSKSKGYKSIYIISVALIVYLFNLALAGLIIIGICNNSLLIIFFWLFICKLLIDFTILSGITSFTGKRKLMRYFIPLELVYIFYVVIIGFIGIVRGYEWKGRRISSE